MAMSTTPFLTFQDIATNAVMVLNVTAFEEHAPVRRGGRQRAFDGTMLSTEGDSKYEANATVEFLHGFEVQLFLNFISSRSGADFRPEGSRLVRLRQVQSNSSGRNNFPLDVYVHVGRRTPFEHLEPSGIAGGSVLVTGWSVELLIEEY